MSPIQTFLPYPDYALSAKVLDRQRLGKQRVEVLQMLNVLHQVDETTGWWNHPAVRMWRGHEAQLAEYGLVICEEWKSRGYNDTCYDKISYHLEAAESGGLELPDWFGDNSFHDAHKSNLMRKDPRHYGQYFGADFPQDLPYIWPVSA